MKVEPREKRIVVIGNVLASYNFVNGRDAIINCKDDGCLPRLAF